MQFNTPASRKSNSSNRIRFCRLMKRSLAFEALDRRLLMAADLEQAMETEASDIAAWFGQGALRTRVSRELLDLHALSINPNAPIVTATMQDFLMVAEGKVQVHVAGSEVGQVEASLTQIGFETLFLNPAHHSLDGYLPIAAIPQLEDAISEFSVGVLPNFRPMTGVGLVTSEADIALQTKRVRDTQPLGYDGSGMRIGVLSDSYNNLGGAAADIASGDLPAGVTILQDLGSGGIDEGRAMLQLVHDLAPGADLGFATAFVGGQAGFAANITALANTFNADVIVDDIFYFAEPLFQDGLIAQAITNVTNSGTAYVSLAGNLSDQAYEAQGPFATEVESFTIPGFGAVSVTALDMDPGAGTDFRQSITIANNQQVILTFQWDDPFFASVDTDIDVFLVDTTNNEAVAFGVTDNLFTQQPVEVVGFTNTTGATRTYEIVLDLFGGPAPGRIKWVNYGANNSGDITIEYDTNSPTVIPHSTAPGALSVGAVAYFEQDNPQSYTSIGPATILFTPGGSPITPEVRAKPDIAAIDGVNNTFFGSDVEGDGRPNFFGTSAAAPHAAAVAALVKQANPSFTPAQIFSAMTSTAEDLGPVGFDNVTGFGLVDAYAAIYGEGLPASLPLVEDFEDGVLGPAWVVDSTGNGRVRVITGSGPAAGYHHLAMDTFLGGPFGLNEAVLHFDATGAEDIVLTFQHAEFGDEDHPMPATFTGSINADGVALSVDGQNWFRLISLTGAESSATYRARKFNLTDIAASNSLTLGANVMIKFQQFDNSPINSDGIVFDNITIQDKSIVAAGWQPLGPFSATRGQTENVAPNNNVSGAMHTVIAHPTDPDILYAGGTNGGVWKTTNATAGLPNWVPLTDSMPSQSIGALTFDRSDPETIYAGVGLYSSFGRIGNNRTGLLASTDGGATFSVVNAGGLLTGKNISGLHVNGDTIVLSVNFADSFTYGNIGIFRSTNAGTSFVQISNGNGAATGLPGGSSYDLVADPLDPNILYTSVIFADGVEGVNGVYKSIDQGATWAMVFTRPGRPTATGSPMAVKWMERFGKSEPMDPAR